MKVHDEESTVELETRSISRRRLLQIVGASSAGLLLAACGSDDDDDTSDPTSVAGDDATDEPTTETETASDEPTAADSEDAAPTATSEPSGDVNRIEAYAAIVGPPPEDPYATNIGTPRFGGDLVVASHDEPVTLDGHLNTRSVVQYLSSMMCEGLFAWNLDAQSVSALAEGHSWNDDFTELTVELRQGVLFHDGSELTSEVVQANVMRWISTPLGSDMAEIIESVDTPSDYTVVFHLSRSFPFLVLRMTVRQASSLWILSKNQIDGLANPEDDIGVPIGTGPYKFDEWRDNQFLRLVRFDDYVGREEPPSGEAGGKVAYLDSITFQWVADESVRIAGLQTGEYHVAENILADHYERFKDDPDIRTRLTLGTWPCVHFNMQSGPMADPLVRQAFAAAVDVTQIAAALGPEEFYPLSPSLMPGDASPWYSEAGMDTYLEYDPEKARTLLEESGYNGEEIRWLVNPDQSTSYTPGIVAESMLEEVGFNVELVHLDAATLASYRADPNRMDAFSCAWSPQPDPTLMAAWQEGFPGWWDTEEKNEILAQMRMETDHEVRLQMWEDFQNLYYTQLPGIKISDENALVLESEKFSGTRIQVIFYYFINTWLNE